MTITEEIRAGFASILKRYEGNALAAVRTDFLAKVKARMEEDQERLASCTCGAAARPFEIIDRDTPAYAALRQAGIDRIKDADEAATNARKG